jgi:hypothetical protein
MVKGRSGIGGPQTEEVLRMLAGHNRSLEAGFEWLNASRSHLVGSAAGLEREFLQLK